MDSSNPIHDLILHAEWADATLWGTLLGDTETLYDSRVESWQHHIHTVQHAFHHLWRGEALDLPEISSFQDVHALARWGREGHASIQEFLAGAEPSLLQGPLAIPWTKHVEERLGKPAGPVTIEQSALQVAMHSAHHRAQVAARVRELGGEPPLTDFIAWLWLGRPTAKWP